MKMLLVILVCLIILLVSSILGIYVAIQLDVYFSKERNLKKGEHISYLPEKIVKLETEFEGGGGIHFRGESGKLFRCYFGKKICEAIQPTDKISGQPAFRETASLYSKFAAPPAEIKQTVLNRSRGLMSHHTERQFALLEDGRVWYWFFSGNEMGESFPFWHLEHWLTIVLGTLAGLIFGLIISALVWLKFVPRP